MVGVGVGSIHIYIGSISEQLSILALRCAFVAFVFPLFTEMPYIVPAGTIINDGRTSFLISGRFIFYTDGILPSKRGLFSCL